jgi:hypothetical protein
MPEITAELHPLSLGNEWNRPVRNAGRTPIIKLGTLVNDYLA